MTDADTHHAVHGNYAERAPTTPPDRPRVWAYTDRLSYAPGDRVAISVNTNAATCALTLARDGHPPVWGVARLPGAWRATPPDCSVVGCGWPVSATLTIPPDWPSGGYVLRSSVEGDHHDHLILVTPAAARPGRLLLIAATASWTAYNDWGGSNHYQGLTGPTGDRPSPILSIHRPYARGFVTLPPDAPRAVLADPPAPMTAPRYPHMEWAHATGHSKKYASAGWASYERPFVAWAAAEGLPLDIIAQTDLHDRPDLLAGYSCVVMVGHDEYWSWQMRDALDTYVQSGGNAARFAANFMWQIRLQDGGATQVCYKYRARTDDPLMTTGPRHLVTECWESAPLNRPGAASFGLNATQGLYAGWSGASPRGAMGFPVYRPDHWAFAGTGLYYGDILGARSRIFGYEVDGLAYEIRGGLPYALNAHPGHDDFTILALGLASTVEEGPTIHPGQSFLGTEDAEYVATLLTGAGDAAAVERTKRGCGMIVAFRHGAGQVFHAGTCDWVMGLALHDPMVAQVTRNVLTRFLR